MRCRAAWLVSLPAAGLIASTAHAGETGPSLTGNLTIVSDYRYRGISLTSGHPALQGEINIATTDGLYADLFASTIEYGSARQEFDFTVGQKVRTGGMDFDFAVTRYVFPGGANLDYWELPVSISRTQGEWTWKGGAAYAPPQRGTYSQSNTYGYVRMLWQPSRQPYSIAASIGYEDGAFAHQKMDWSLTATRRVSAAQLSLRV